MNTGGHGPIEEIRDVLTGEAAGASGGYGGYEPVPEGEMMNEVQGPSDRDNSPVEVAFEEHQRRPPTIDVPDEWGLEGAPEGGPDDDFVPGDPVTNDLTDADPDARPRAEAATQPKPQVRRGL